DLRPAARAVGDPDLLGREQDRRPAELRERMADRRLRRAVHRRRVDQPSTLCEEGADDLDAGLARRDIVADVEGDPGTETDDGQCLAGRWNPAGLRRT